jgi:hypothetical protein
MISRYFLTRGLKLSPYVSRIILSIGIIEFRGVLNSCAIDEKNIARIFLESLSISFILVMSEQMTMI